MSKYTLADGLYLYPTPAGAYYAVSSTTSDKPREFLKKLLAQRTTPKLSLETLRQLAGDDDTDAATALLYRCHKLNWVQGLTAPEGYPVDKLEEILPGLLKNMSENGKVLLADMQGFYLASHGFTEDLAEELSGISAELTSLHERRSVVLTDHLGIPSNAWGIIDVFGNSQIGFWPLFIGKNRFVIVISGNPHFNQPAFVKLIWALSIRYATGNMNK